VFDPRVLGPEALAARRKRALFGRESGLRRLRLQDHVLQFVLEITNLRPLPRSDIERNLLSLGHPRCLELLI
jgi:hypothetical protein